jgi:DNA-binding response OmpR family regulator
MVQKSWHDLCCSSSKACGLEDEMSVNISDQAEGTPCKRGPSSAPARIAVAEDDDDFRSLVAGVLKTAGYDVSAAANGLELLQSIEFDALEPSAAPAFDAAVIDVRMPGVTGLSVAEGLAEAGYRGRILLMSAFADDALVAEALRVGAYGVLAKPFPMSDLLFEVRQLLARRQM